MKTMYQEKVRYLLKLGLFGYIGGLVVMSGLMMEFGDVLTWLFAGFACAGIPYGWILSEKLLGGLFVVGSIPVMLIAFMLRGIAAIFTGWFAYPVVLIYNIIKAYLTKA